MTTPATIALTVICISAFVGLLCIIAGIFVSLNGIAKAFRKADEHRNE